MTMAAGIISAMPGISELSPLYLACVTAAIAGGSTVCSHFNDSGFWLVKSLVLSLIHILSLLSDYDLTGEAPSAAGTLVLGYGSLKDEACASVGETLKKVCTAAREASVTV